MEYKLNIVSYNKDMNSLFMCVFVMRYLLRVKYRPITNSCFFI